MKIISRYKDYYDHMIEKYGFDSHIVYDRRPTEEIPILHRDNNLFVGQVLFSICGHYIPVYVERGGKICFKKEEVSNTSGWSRYDTEWFFRKYKDKKSPINVRYRCPVLAQNHGCVSLPILSQFGFPARFSADEMYQKIYSFLGWLKDNPEPPNSQTNKDKILAHGFDLKSSFRPNIKVK